MTKLEAERKRRREFFRYIFHEYFKGDYKLFFDATGYTAVYARNWMTTQTPRKATLDYILHCHFAPEFEIVCEFQELDGEKKVQTQLKEFLGSHANLPGIYAFYDARAQLLYLGKAGKLLQEVTQALLKPAVTVMPAGIRNKECRRGDLVTYLSAYHVPGSSHRDHPKHVESLLLRISKPPLNKQIGKLSKADRPAV